MQVLVCTDFSASAAAAEREAAARFPDAELVVFHATDPRLVQRIADMTGLDKGELRAKLVHYADVRLSEIVDRLVSQGRRAIAELAEGDPVDMALAAAEQHRVVTIVTGGTWGEPSARFRSGVIRRSRWPVLMVPAEG